MLQENNWKPRVLIAGTAIGALAGLAAGYLLSRTAEESGGDPPEISTIDGIKVTLAIIGVVRAIASLGD
jgi:hypothetical protein